MFHQILTTKTGLAHGDLVLGLSHFRIIQGSGHVLKRTN
jgi:hypothetical protein